MQDPKIVGLLIRARGGAGAALRAAPTAAGMGVVPLFENADKRAALGAVGEEWLLTRQVPDAHSPWDAAHAAVGSLGIAGDTVFVEPDLEQEFIAFEDRPAAGFTARSGNGIADPQDHTLPVGPEFAWHLRPDFSQLRSAREAASRGMGVRIAHLDTGFDPNHETKPVNLLDAFAWDFVDGKAGAADIDERDLLKNHGHGTGTLSILAGNAVKEYEGTPDAFLGGAPLADVIPFRIANSVVLFRTSALAQAIDRAIKPRDAAGNALDPVDVITLSMGGLASAAWAEAVNAAYEAGICMVAAAGNNFSIGIGAFPTRFTVYPARFRRVIAACGVMANRSPYSGLPIGRMQGNYGPASKMPTAISAFTPNMSWAELGAAQIVDMNGAGTSSATPQVAAAAALFIARNRAALQAMAEPWRRVEAVRHALFSTANRNVAGVQEKLGNGILQANDALGVAPVADLPMTPADSARLALLKVLTGLGLREDPGRAAMFELEAAQLVQRPAAAGQANVFEDLVPDPDNPASPMSDETRRGFLGALRDHPAASRAIKSYLDGALARGGGRPVQVPGQVPPPAARSARPASASSPVPPPPTERRLRGYAFDPSLKLRMDTSAISEVTFRVPWEKDLKPGPQGEYLEVIDYDPASRAFYQPVDLNHPHLLAQDGLPPSEGNPQFHQQMVYAVASLTIGHFEAALGRPALWAPGPPPAGANPRDDSNYVQRLRIYPHALRNANAYYSPTKKALLFGYFRAKDTDPGEHLPGGLVFACLSHDIVAHETAHALLDGMHRRFSEATNPDQRAFHEAFADIVALLQHFTFPEILRRQIGQTRGDLRWQQNLLGQMASQFGQALGMHGALRSYIGQQATPDQYRKATEAHARGAVLVAAVFDAFLMVYEVRTRDLLRIATGGTGVLPSGALHPDLVNRLADEAAKAAEHVLRICIRALDYCPPVDMTFGEYLRALITADRDMVPNDRFGYRVAFIDAFRRRGIYPPGMRTLSEDSLVWRSPEEEGRKPSPQLIRAVQFLREEVTLFNFASSRHNVFMHARDLRVRLHTWLQEHLARSDVGDGDARFLGLLPGKSFEVHSARFANRVGPDGVLLPQFVIELLQRTTAAGDTAGSENGCTLIIDVKGIQIRYVIRKHVGAVTAPAQGQSLWNTYFGSCGGAWAAQEPFAMLHRSNRDEG